MQQTILRPQSNMPPQSNGRAQSPSVILIALTLFALAGLMIGFAVGVFTHQKSAQTANSNKGTSMPVVAQKATAQQSPTVDVLAIGVGCPTLPQYSLTEVADSTTPYTAQIQATDKSLDHTSACGKGKSLQTTNITCRLWLAQDVKDAIPSNILTNISTFPAVFPNEMANTLNFTDNSQQTQACASNGQATWHYTLSTNVHPGTYYLEVLTDWQGKAWNWSWRQITVTATGNN